MSIATSEYLTIEEAAEMLRVSTSTIRRWIRDGDIAAHRIGRRRVVLRKDDIAMVVSEIRPEAASAEPVGAKAGIRANPMISNWAAGLAQQRLTDAEKEQGLAALRRLEELNAELRARTGRARFSPSWVLINEGREERSRQLWGDDQDGEANS